MAKDNLNETTIEKIVQIVEKKSIICEKFTIFIF